MKTEQATTEKTRKERRKNPATPSALAKATTFCFHPLRLAGTRHSSHQFMFRQHRVALFWSSPNPLFGTKSAAAQTRGRVESNRAATIVRRRRDRNDS